MSREKDMKRETDAMTSEEKRVKETLGALAEPKSTEVFRRTLRREFASGEILAREKKPDRDFGLMMVHLVSRVLVPAAAAAFVGFWVWNWNQAPAWEVTGPLGEGTLYVHGTPYSVRDFQEIEKVLIPGAELRLEGESDLDLISEGVMALQITPNTEMILPASPGRLWNRTVEGRVVQGEIRVTTGKLFHGSELFIHTPEADVHLMGSTMAVIRDSVSTCVCAYAGCIFMAPSGSDLVEIEDGMRRFIFNDGRAPEEMEIDARENMKLQMFLEGSTADLRLGGE